MARISRWRPQVFESVKQTALGNAYDFMDSIVAEAKVRCPPPGKTNITRPDGWSNAVVAFTPKRGKNKGKLVTFSTTKRWVGRNPGDLKATIRRVGRHDAVRSNIRVYAGNFKIYWAFMVEYGTDSTGWGGPARATPFLRPTWNAKKRLAAKAIKTGTL